jgi:hypothetical protein
MERNDGWIWTFEVAEESSNFAKTQRIGMWGLGGIGKGGEEERYAMRSGQRGRLGIGSFCCWGEEQQGLGREWMRVEKG